MRALPLLLVATILAGCTSGTSGPEPVDVEPLWVEASAIGGFRDGVVVDTGYTAEPGLHVAPDGTLYVLSWTRLWRSDDGVRWTDVSPGLQTSGDGTLAIAPDGTFHLAGTGLGRDPMNVPYVRSTDRGETWSTPKELVPEGSIDRPWLHAHPDGALRFVYNDWRASGPRSARAATADAHGRTPASWTAPISASSAGRPRGATARSSRSTASGPSRSWSGRGRTGASSRAPRMTASKRFRPPLTRPVDSTSP